MYSVYLNTCLIYSVMYNIHAYTCTYTMNICTCIYVRTVEPRLSEPRLTGCSLYPAKHLRAYALVPMRTAHVFQLMGTHCVMATAGSKKRKRVVLSIESKIL